MHVFTIFICTYTLKQSLIYLIRRMKQIEAKELFEHKHHNFVEV